MWLVETYVPMFLLMLLRGGKKFSGAFGIYDSLRIVLKCQFLRLWPFPMHVCMSKDKSSTIVFFGQK